MRHDVRVGMGPVSEKTFGLTPYCLFERAPLVCGVAMAAI